MRLHGPALSIVVLMGLVAGCTGSAPETFSAPAASPVPSAASPVPSKSPNWPPLPVRPDAPPGVTLLAQGETVTLANQGTTVVFWPLRIDAWTGPSWRSIRPPEGDESMNGLYPGDTYSWTFDPRTGPVRVAVRLWPDQTRSGAPWFLWADLPANGAAGPAESPLPEYGWRLGISNATTMTVALVVNGTTVGTFPPHPGGGTFARSQLPPLPWLVEAKSPGGHVLVSMTIRDGDIWYSTSANGGSGQSAPGARVDMACGRVDIYVGGGLAGPGPPPSVPPCPP